MPPFFDAMDWSDPNTQAAMGAMSGMAKGFGQAAMPSSLPIGLGAALSMGASGATEGALAGARGAQDYRSKNLDISGKTVSNDQALLIENMLRESLGKPPLTAADVAASGSSVRSPLFGNPSLSPKAQPIAPAAVAATASAFDPKSNGAPQQAGTTDTAAPASISSPSSDAVKNALKNKLLFGSQPTDYQKAKMFADGLPDGPDKVEAQQAAAKAAGIEVSADARPGAVHLLWDPTNNRYKVAFRNPHLPEGYTLDDSGNVVAAPGGPEAVSDIAARETGAKVAGKFKEEAFGNWLETGGNGLGTSTGGVAAPGNAGPGPTFASRVAQLEGGGAANPPANDASSATGAHQFLNGTWLEQAKKFLPQQVLAGKSDDQILAMRSDPQASAMVTNGYARSNADALDRAGVKNVGAPELYLAHHFGAAGAQAILKAPANTPLEQVLSPQVMAANPDLKGGTVADVYSHARQAMNGLAPAPTQAQVKAGDTGGVQSKIPDISQAAPINKGEIYLKERIPEWAKQENEWSESLQSNQIGEQRALAIGEALKATQAGHWATEKADIAAKLKAVGVDIGKQSWFGDPAEVQTALKDNFQATLAQIRAFTSRPAAVEVQLASKNFANPNLQPEANLKIIGQTIGTMRWERSLVNDWAQAKKQGWQDPQDFQRAWMKENPIQPYIDKSIKEIGPLKGMGPTPGLDHPALQNVSLTDLEYTAHKNNMTVDQLKNVLKAKGVKIPN